ncbi:hypothetical protein A2348_04930 [Candidatus Uhrbacteria bacterium RIFOXYB12_FULL_58_10]|uniref:Uncharacterized protein n=1 Tax=Candidatus Uhrbacteria bacterium RIFOXYB2_FULL_57_15 TaxID=1802422 RepID=A0A1F7W7N7_9BACT|nr:MAG: hypothetical protein A2348_04930 [Candidatus Uhrbacteria bacterium RIFOXYB12_FULL_58_10]OGL98813.1 MAG: hypothetical protein A2304_04955 [Candidatus Uhrbacteria bacterium RIFOXYB2_FULL_57_15]
MNAMDFWDDQTFSSRKCDKENSRAKGDRPRQYLCQWKKHVRDNKEDSCDRRDDDQTKCEAWQPVFFQFHMNDSIPYQAQFDLK